MLSVEEQEQSSWIPATIFQENLFCYQLNELDLNSRHQSIAVLELLNESQKDPKDPVVERKWHKNKCCFLPSEQKVLMLLSPTLAQGAVPKGNATKEFIESLQLKPGQVVYKCPKCCSIKPDRAHHCRYQEVPGSGGTVPRRPGLCFLACLIRPLPFCVCAWWLQTRWMSVWGFILLNMWFRNHPWINNCGPTSSVGVWHCP